MYVPSMVCVVDLIFLKLVYTREHMKTMYIFMYRVWFVWCVLFLHAWNKEPFGVACAAEVNNTETHCSPFFCE